jgi:hypothetical protein
MLFAFVTCRPMGEKGSGFEGTETDEPMEV